jgi:hypothetical protein
MLQGLTVVCDNPTADGTPCGATAIVIRASYAYDDIDFLTPGQLPTLLEARYEISAPTADTGGRLRRRSRLIPQTRDLKLGIVAGCTLTSAPPKTGQYRLFRTYRFCGHRMPKAMSLFAARRLRRPAAYSRWS